MLSTLKYEDLPSYEIGWEKGIEEGLEKGMEKGLSSFLDQKDHKPGFGTFKR